MVILSISTLVSDHRLLLIDCHRVFVAEVAFVGGLRSYSLLFKLKNLVDALLTVLSANLEARS